MKNSFYFTLKAIFVLKIFKFRNISKLSISLDQWSKILIQFVFIVCQAEDYWKILKPSCRPLAFTSCEAFLENILISLPHFLHNFRRKIFLMLYCINWPNFIVWLLLFPEIFNWAKCVLLLYVKQVVTSYILKLILAF